jgi:hypothetical protein
MSWARIQGAYATHGFGNVTSIGATGSAVTSGNLVAGFVGYGDSQGINNLASVTSDQGDTATIVDKIDNTTSLGCLASFYFNNCTSGAKTWTANFTTGISFVAILWDEFSGNTASTALDGHAMQTQINPGNAADALKSGTAVGASGDLIYGCNEPDGDDVTLVIGTGFNSASGSNNDVNFPLLSEFLSASGAHDATFTTSNGTANDFVTGVMAFTPGAVSPNVSLVAAAATAAASAFGIQANIGFGGVSGTASVIGLGSTLNFALGVSSSAGAVASFSDTISSNVALVAAAAVAAVGSFAANVSVPLVAVSATAAAVAFGIEVDVALGVVSSIAAAGVFSVTATGLLNVSLIGVAANAVAAAFAQVTEVGLSLFARTRRGGPGHPHRGGGGG